MISNSIINNDFIEKNLINIIPSSILLDANNNIKSVSKEVCQFLRYSYHDLNGKNISEVLVTKDNKIEKELKQMRLEGFFKPIKITIQNKYKKNIEAEVSGFYLGIISDFSEYIIIGIRDVQKLKTYQSLLEEKIDDFNELIYSTYHDLSGPIATIKGLVNIADYCKDVDEFNTLFKLIGNSTDTLKDRLSNISLIFDHSVENHVNISELNLDKIRSCIVSSMPDIMSAVEINVSTNNLDLNETIVGEDVVTKIIRYSVLCFLSFHKAVEDKTKLNLTLKLAQDNFLFTFEFEGFSGNSELMEKAIFNKHKFSDLINEENVLNYYLLRKLIQNYNGTFIPDFEHESKKGFKIALYDY